MLVSHDQDDMRLFNLHTFLVGFFFGISIKT